MERQRRVKFGQIEVNSEYVSFPHEDVLGRYYSTVKVGSPDWFKQIAQITSFSFTASAGGFVARNESRRGERGFWYAYRKVDDKTKKVYIGKTEAITWSKLREVVAKFKPPLFT